MENPKNKKQILSAHSSEVKWYIWIENYLIQYLLGQENFPNVNQILLNKKKERKIESELEEKQQIWGINSSTKTH